MHEMVQDTKYGLMETIPSIDETSTWTSFFHHSLFTTFSLTIIFITRNSKSEKEVFLYHCMLPKCSHWRKNKY